MAVEFVHLHVHTQFSFLIGTIKIKELAGRARKLNMSAVAMTDHHNMFGAIRHYNNCKKAGVRPILGSEVNIAMPSGGLAHLVLLAATNEGYQNLIPSCRAATRIPRPTLVRASCSKRSPSAPKGSSP